MVINSEGRDFPPAGRRGEGALGERKKGTWEESWVIQSMWRTVCRSGEIHGGIGDGVAGN